VRALLIVNPHATSTTRLRRDVIARALASAVELEIAETQYRGHGTRLAAAAAAQGYGLVLTLGGDGTVNETVNGLLQGTGTGARDRPALAPLPGGSANVFVRALGLPADPVDAAGQVLAALAAGRSRCVGLGLAGDRYFTFNAGMGFDAEVVRVVEGRRAHGRAVSPALYVRMASRQFWRITDRHTPAIRLTSAGEPTDSDMAGEALFWCTVSNTSPWTYVGRRPVRTNPDASFDTGLDVFGLRRLGTPGTARTLAQMLSQGRTRPPRGRAILTAHDLDEVVLAAERPVALQIDGEYVGECEQVQFRSVPKALRVVM
jgi:diacylglycerol kinase family enzyme